MKGKIFGGLLFLLVCASLVLAEFYKPENPIKLKWIPAEGASAGSTIEAKLNVEITKGWHIFSEKPELEGINATRIVLDPYVAFSVEKISFPKPVAIHSDVFQKTLNFYQDQFTITVALKMNADASGEIPVKGTFYYQACSDRLCLPPGKLAFSGVQPVQK